MSFPVSIPQAVSAVATYYSSINLPFSELLCFNTASGKRCCNNVNKTLKDMDAVGFNTASGKRCCNSRVWKASIYAVPKASFGKPQTVNGKFSPH